MTPGDPAERDEGHARGAGAIGGDLWSAPVSAQPADDLLAGHCPARHGRHRTRRHGVPGGPSRQAPAVPRRSMSLVVAVAVLIRPGLRGPAARPVPGRCDQSPGHHLDAEPVAVPGRHAGQQRGRDRRPPYLPMQADSAGLDCFFVG